ncbi:MAG: 30S ribosomal protein S6 [Nitrospirae bacterium]|nr:30S ribosomal protein S6 [Nitrospirota bacterium]
MSIYESISILKPSLSEEEIQKIQSRVEGIIRKDGDLIAFENWGKKKLAYDVRKEKRGVYLMFRFRGTGKNIPELERAYRFDDNVIKFMTVKLEKPAAAHVEQVVAAKAAQAAPAAAVAKGEGEA